MLKLDIDELVPKQCRKEVAGSRSLHVFHTGRRKCKCALMVEMITEESISTATDLKEKWDKSRKVANFSRAHYSLPISFNSVVVVRPLIQFPPHLVASLRLCLGLAKFQSSRNSSQSDFHIITGLFCSISVTFSRLKYVEFFDFLFLAAPIHTIWATFVDFECGLFFHAISAEHHSRIETNHQSIL